MRQSVEFMAGTAVVWSTTTDDGPARGRGRRLLQYALGTTYRRDPNDITLIADECGRPSLLTGQDLPPVRLSAAHCGALTVAATALGFQIGIDVETHRALPAPELLLHALSARERALLATSPPDARSAVFHTLWTAKEAVAKASGWPLLRALVDVEVTTQPRLHVARLGQDTSPTGWELTHIDPPGATVTVAAHAPSSAIYPAARRKRC